MIVFPSELLKPTDSVLCLFCAAYHGVQDVQFVKDAGCTDVLLVDKDAVKLYETSIQHQYPSVCCDAFDFIMKAAKAGKKWDVVISDQWTNDDIVINVGFLDLLTSISRRHLILGYCKRSFKDRFISPGRYEQRSEHLGGVYWRIIEL